MVRAVLDAGVLVSALITPAGTTARLLRAWEEGRFELIVSPVLLEELGTVLMREKFRSYVDEREARAYVALLRNQAIVVEDPAEAPRATPDPKDDYLPALADAAHAHVLVSGDPDLTETPGFSVPVLTPRHFLDSLSTPDRNPL